MARSGPSDGTSLLFFLAWKQEWVNYRPGTYLFGMKIKFFLKKSPYIILCGLANAYATVNFSCKGPRYADAGGEESRIVNPIGMCS